MPSTFKIPEHVQHTCRPCEHLKFENALYGRTFVTGTYVCHHPEANDFTGPKPKDPLIAQKLAELHASISKQGRMISNNEDRRPSWCPLWRQENENPKQNR